MPIASCGVEGKGRWWGLGIGGGGVVEGAERGSKDVVLLIVIAGNRRWRRGW